jgi:Spy/CpxP family protein refolding chaperone
LPNCNKTFAEKLRICSGRAFLSLALILLVLLPGAIVAQAAGAASPAHQTRRAPRRPSLDDRVQGLAKSLDLSEAQQAAVRKILEQRQQEALRNRFDSSLSGAARIERFRALQENTVLRIRAVLNEEQKKKYDPLAVRRLQPAPDQRSVEDWIKLTTPE